MGYGNGRFNGINLVDFGRWFHEGYQTIMGIHGKTKGYE